MMKQPKLVALLLIWSVFLVSSLQAQKLDIPKVYSNIKQDKNGRLYIEKEGKRIYENQDPPRYTYQNLVADIKGNNEGIALDFNMPELKGVLYYGFIPYQDGKHPLPVYFRSDADIIKGKTSINIARLKGRYDMIDWEKNKKGVIAYRVLNEKGEILYDGKAAFTYNGSFQAANTILEGPFVNLLNPEGATISLESSEACIAEVSIAGKQFKDVQATKKHEITLSGLKPNTRYDYTVKCGENEQTFSFRTAPKTGARTKFSFAYASDSRNGQGGGERDVYGTNFYIMRKIMALATQQSIAFFQFSGDLINGYLTNPDEIRLQYANWKRAVEPFWHYFPVYTTMGNHEALTRNFGRYGEDIFLAVDRFPFETESAEAIFAECFVNPKNGLKSEDGASYDPDKKRQDFPSYEENVFYYTYDNVGVIVLNSNYFYAPNTKEVPFSSGGLHAYIMDQQIEWLEQTLKEMEANPDIDHIFISQHTPLFPNGGHVKDDMWYDGNNKFRSFVAGKGLEKGIIERRDQILELAVNKSQKVRAFLTGDEHNYAKTAISPDMEIYPENYDKPKIKLSRTIYQINNGAAGAPYYAQEQTPWTPQVSGFSTQNALVIFDVEGDSIQMRVINPETLVEFDYLKFETK